MPEFTIYRRTHMAHIKPYVLGELEMRPYVPGEPETFNVSDMDREAGSPVLGDMIARNPRNHNHQWLVAAQNVADHYESQ